ncbi:hypothetical protein [Thermoactinospora rubra]|uniref:hypothetical protein n=1 Tax=Thermoactinospora rubra TaxID=1088767 RepID=UPI00146FC4DD|nr:hypothetical protein [Thermoactinospora rubra]
MDVVVDPEVPEDEARLLRENASLLARVRDGWVPEPRSRHLASRIPDLGVALFVCGILVLTGMAVAGVGSLLVAGAALAAFALIFARDSYHDETETGRAVYQQARWHEGRYVLVEDLDEASRRLLRRAQRAIRAITESDVNTEGLLDGARNAVTLPAHEWEIARLLAKLSGLRTEHRELVAGEITPEVAAVAEPLARALDSSEAAVVARVEALETYAAHVAEAERAYRARHQIEQLRSRLPQYEELVAESGADALAVPELGRLAEDAGDLERALRRSLRSAHEAFRHLAP